MRGPAPAALIERALHASAAQRRLSVTIAQHRQKVVAQHGSSGFTLETEAHVVRLAR